MGKISSWGSRLCSFFSLSFLFLFFCVLCGVILNSVFKSVFSIMSAAGFRKTKQKRGSTVRVKI